jgi:hypothetical protein
VCVHRREPEDVVVVVASSLAPPRNDGLGSSAESSAAPRCPTDQPTALTTNHESRLRCRCACVSAGRVGAAHARSALAHHKKRKHKVSEPGSKPRARGASEGQRPGAGVGRFHALGHRPGLSLSHADDGPLSNQQPPPRPLACPIAPRPRPARLPARPSLTLHGVARARRIDHSSRIAFALATTRRLRTDATPPRRRRRSPPPPRPAAVARRDHEA